MIIAHLPSGYLLGRALPRSRAVMAAALLGSVFPDFDMFWFHLIDHGAVHHHAYWTHVPAFWALVSLIVLPLCYRRRAWLPACAFLAGIWLHLLLDTIAGGIMWAWPFSDRLFVLHEVQATHNHWVKSFMADWTFLLEVVIWVAAIALYFKPRKPVNFSEPY